MKQDPTKPTLILTKKEKPILRLTEKQKPILRLIKKDPVECPAPAPKKASVPDGNNGEKVYYKIPYARSNSGPKYA